MEFHLGLAELADTRLGCDHRVAHLDTLHAVGRAGHRLQAEDHVGLENEAVAVDRRAAEELVHRTLCLLEAEALPLRTVLDEAGLLDGPS